MHGVRPANRPRRSLRESEITHFAFAHQLGHRPDGILDRRVGIDPMLVIEIDHLDTETLEARFAALPDILGSAVDAEHLAVLCTDVAEFGRDNDAFAAPAD